MLRQPATTDNAGMQTEPIKAEPPKRKRRFQFRLRTLLIGVTLLAVVCGYVGWQAKIVKERRNEIDWGGYKGNLRQGIDIRFYREVPEVPWLRRKLDDVYVREIDVAVDAPRDQVEHLHRLFPEAYFHTVSRSDIPLPELPWNWIRHPAGR